MDDTIIGGLWFEDRVSQPSESISLASAHLVCLAVPLISHLNFPASVGPASLTRRPVLLRSPKPHPSLPSHRIRSGLRSELFPLDPIFPVLLLLQVQCALLRRPSLSPLAVDPCRSSSTILCSYTTEVYTHHPPCLRFSEIPKGKAIRARVHILAPETPSRSSSSLCVVSLYHT